MENTFIAGFIAGSFQTLLGHPLDTIKVWKQNNTKHKLTISNLFRGLSYPLLSASFLNSIQFSSAAFYRKQLTNNTNISTDVIVELKAGAFSGLVFGCILAPIDYFKIKRQSFSKTPQLGLSACMMREIPGSSIYFGTYTYLRNKNISIFLSGSIAGCLSWGLIYPCDIIKTNIQSGKTKNIRNSIEFLIKNRSHIYSGLGICLLRAAIVNGVGFYTYEKIISSINLSNVLVNLNCLY